jgi:hypothetical protein
MTLNQEHYHVSIFMLSGALFIGRHDIQHKDIQDNSTQRNDTQHDALICDTQHNSTERAFVLSVIMLNVANFYCYVESHYAKCRYAECLAPFIGMANVVRLYVVMLNVVAPTVFVVKFFCFCFLNKDAP